jgi:hypothetical protein
MEKLVIGLEPLRLVGRNAKPTVAKPIIAKAHELEDQDHFVVDMFLHTAIGQSLC